MPACIPAVLLGRQLRDASDAIAGFVRVRTGLSCIAGVCHFADETRDGMVKKVLWPVVTVRRSLPLGIENLPRGARKAFDSDTDYTFTEGGLLELENAFVCAKPCGVILEDGRILDESSKLINRSIFRHSAIKRCRLQPDAEVSRAWLGHSHAAFNYYHWLIDVLPMLLMPACRELLDRHRPTIVLPPLHMPFHKAALQLLDLPPCRLITMEQFDILKAGVLHVPVLPRRTDQLYPVVLEALRSHFLPKVRVGSPSKRIYLTRAGGKRGLTNEGEIQSVLAKHRISTVRLESLPFIEQIELLANTELVVAPHGAGLANTVFLPRGSSVIETFSPTYVNPCFWRIASALGCSYSALCGVPFRSFEPMADAYRVDPSALDDLIKQTSDQASRAKPVSWPASVDESRCSIRLEESS